MSTKPILFSTPMVQAILAGRKTMTRRVIKFPEGLTGSHQVGESGNPKNPLGLMWVCGIKRPKYQPGDILWVRETWVKGGSYFYKATDNGLFDENVKWRPSIHMPREAARIFLRVTGVRVERVQDITPYDAWCEGCRIGNSFPWEEHIPELQQQCRDIVFSDLWDNINAKRGYGWETNPWVWVYEFERVDEA